ncbi:MAG TPA: hypothetical protein VFG79_10375, partial [Solirubrobacter sp.]|nr:hypothetical protein [Solirubrobacter sp.]
MAIRPVAISRLAPGALCAAALVNALAVAFVVPRSAQLVTTYAQASGAASALELGAGLALLAAGIVAWHERAGGSLGPLAVLLGLVWFAQDWVGWEDGWPPARSVAMLALPFGPALLLHVALAAPRGRLSRGAPRTLVTLGYAAAALVSGGLALVRDPFADPYCWSNCADNVLLVHSDLELARTLGVLASAAGAGTAVLAVAVAAWRLVTATGAGRRASWPVLAPAALAGAAEAAYGAALLWTPLEDPGRAGFMAVFCVRATALAALAAGVAWTALRARRVRAALARIRAESAPLRELLARALGDPGVSVA